MQQQDCQTGSNRKLDCHGDSGVLRIGPMKKMTAEDVRGMLEHFGITTGGDDSIRVVPHQMDTVQMIAAGDSVTGYLLEEFGIEAADEDLDAFVRRNCPAHTPISFKGHYHPDDETRIATVMTAIHDGKRVSWTHLRTRIRDGEVLRLSGTSSPFMAIDCTPATKPKIGVVGMADAAQG